MKKDQEDMDLNKRALDKKMVKSRYGWWFYWKILIEK